MSAEILTGRFRLYNAMPGRERRHERPFAGWLHLRGERRRLRRRRRQRQCRRRRRLGDQQGLHGPEQRGLEQQEEV